MSAVEASSLDSPMWNRWMVEINRSRSSVKSCTVRRLAPKIMIETRSLEVIFSLRNWTAAFVALTCSGGCMEEKSNSIAMSRWS